MLSPDFGRREGDGEMGEIASKFKVLVCGSRNWTDARAVELALEPLNDIILVHGDARGADTIAANYAKKRGWEIHAHPANWAKYHASAGPIRNAEMLATEKPDMVIAFRCKGRSRGTDHMVSLANKAYIPVYVIREEDLVIRSS